MKHLQKIEIKYLGPTETKPSRIRLNDRRFCVSTIIEIDYGDANILTTAQNWLVDRGFDVVAYSSNCNDTYDIMVSNFKSIKD